MLTASAVARWLSALGVSVPVEPGPLPLGSDTATPDVRMVVEPSPGIGPSNDGLVDTVGFRFITRGPPRRVYDESAWTAALQADVLIRLSDQPCSIGGLHVISIARPGAGPTLVGTGIGPGDRLMFAASYQFTYAVPLPS